MVLQLSGVPSVGSYGYATNRIGERQPMRGPVLARRHREFDHTGTGAVLVHLPIRLAARILTLAPQAASAAGAESDFLINMF